MMVFIPTDTGEWVDENYERLARIIKDYDSCLELRWIPPAARTREDKKPYVIVDTRSNSAVMFASELDTPTDILVRLACSDNSKGDVVSRLEAQETAQKLMEHKKWVDELEEAKDKANFLINTPLHYASVDGVKFDADRRRM
jgi:hypothetical protein